ncbi:Npun_R2479 family HD domain-containing metalloprotein [Lyngbya aestuarii]|uniref:Npun_R2479 family HD domain-containing metalloprotein n=1 Tax=Lyngbya aestuarii TaxID=118322 RepID=UPI00403DCDC8
MTDLLLNPTQVLINHCVQQLETVYHSIYGHQKPDYADQLSWAATIALEMIANSDALYHNVEHTILVTLVGQEILRGKHIREGSVSCRDWLHLIISLLCHDIGYVQGICSQDQPHQRIYATGVEQEKITLPPGGTDASLTPYHVDRGKLFIRERFGTQPLLDTQIIELNIELTRFPVPADDDYQDAFNYPGLVRAADLIGQLSDPRYLQKISALFYEFEETGANKILGYRTPGELRQNYPSFYWNVVFRYIQPALSYLELTLCGKQILANLYANVFRVEHGYRENFLSSRRRDGNTFPKNQRCVLQILN